MALAPSARTRQIFREHLVDTTLGYITDVFSGAGVERGSVPPDRMPSGQRRALVEEYYAGADWASDQSVRCVLAAYEHILFETDAGEQKQKLINSLRLDGFSVGDDGRIVASGVASLELDLAGLADSTALGGYERRIIENIENDPELAIGSSKELVEATVKLILDDAGVTPQTDWSAERLFKEALKTFDLTVDSVDDGTAGAESIREVLRSLHQTVVGTAELRNRFGTGHGRPRHSGLGPRHARLVAGAALTLTRFLLDTRAERLARTSNR